MLNPMAKTTVTRRENPDIAPDAVHVRLFGPLELENRWGHVIENRARSSVCWLLLKYLLADPGRAVTVEEAREVLWPADADIDHDGAARVRLRRLRNTLTPLQLGGTDGLVLYAAGEYRLNGVYCLCTDEARFREVTGRLRSCSREDPKGLALCREALELYRGEFMEFTEAAPWLLAYREAYHREFAALARETLARAEQSGDGQAMELLCRRAAVLVPEDEELHRAIIRRLMDTRNEVQLVRHVSQLSRAGERAKWLDRAEL